MDEDNIIGSSKQIFKIWKDLVKWKDDVYGIDIEWQEESDTYRVRFGSTSHMQLADYFHCCGVINVSDMSTVFRAAGSPLKWGKMMFYVAMYVGWQCKKALLTCTQCHDEGREYSQKCVNIIKNVEELTNVHKVGPILNPNSGNLIIHYTIEIDKFFEEVQSENISLEEHFARFINTTKR